MDSSKSAEGYPDHCALLWQTRLAEIVDLVSSPKYNKSVCTILGYSGSADRFIVSLWHTNERFLVKAKNLQPVFSSQNQMDNDKQIISSLQNVNLTEFNNTKVITVTLAFVTSHNEVNNELPVHVAVLLKDIPENAPFSVPSFADKIQNKSNKPHRGWWENEILLKKNGQKLAIWTKPPSSSGQGLQNMLLFRARDENGNVIPPKGGFQCFEDLSNGNEVFLPPPPKELDDPTVGSSRGWFEETISWWMKEGVFRPLGYQRGVQIQLDEMTSGTLIKGLIQSKGTCLFISKAVSGQPTTSSSKPPLVIATKNASYTSTKPTSETAKLFKKQCILCDKMSSNQCHRCKTPYCSEACQIDDWKFHENICGIPVPEPQPEKFIAILLPQNSTKPTFVHVSLKDWFEDVCKILDSSTERYKKINQNPRTEKSIGRMLHIWGDSEGYYNYPTHNQCLKSMAQGIPFLQNVEMRGPLLVLCVQKKDVADDEEEEEDDENFVDAEIQDISRLIDGVCFFTLEAATGAFIFSGDFLSVRERFLNQGKYRKVFKNRKDNDNRSEESDPEGDDD